MGHVVIAVRGGPDAKARCAAVLDRDQRAGLTRAMLADMLDAASHTPAVKSIWVVTPTSELADLAIRAGASALLEKEPRGLGMALARGREMIARKAPRDLTVLLPGDLPLLDAAALNGAMGMWREGEAGLVPAKADGGTGAILLAAAAPFVFAYGVGSLARHAEAAHAARLRPHLIEEARLAFDLDRPADIAAILARSARGQTLAFLEAQSGQLDIAS